MKIPLSLGPSYTKRTLNRVQKCMDWYPERSGDEWVLVGRPGLRVLDTVANNAACRWAYYAEGNGKWYSVNGNRLYEITAAGADTDRGTLSASSGNVVMVDNGAQLLIIQQGVNAYSYNFATTGFALVSDANFPTTPYGCCFIDQRVVVVNGTANFYLSELDDLTDWTPVRSAEAESNPDVLYACFNIDGKLWLVGTSSVEVWYNTGNASFTFERVTGQTYNIGLSAANPKAACALNGNLYMLSSSNGSVAGIWSLGREGQRKISTPDIDDLIASSYASGWMAFAYQDLGHEFVFFSNQSSPSGVGTVVWDNATQAWHQRNSFNGLALTAYRAKVILQAPQSDSVLPMAFDDQDGSVYAVDPNLNTDGAGTWAIQRVRDFGPIEAGANLIFHHKLRLDMEVKYDSTASPTLSATLAKSDNAGQSFDSGVTLSRALTSATTAQRVPLEARRLGSSRERYYRLTMSPAARVVLKLAELDAEMGAH
jgi:hypothetical protein